MNSAVSLLSTETPLRAYTLAMTISFEPLSPDWRDDPYSIFAQLREQAPVHFAPVANAYCISRYDDVLEVMKNSAAYSSEAMGTELMTTNFGGFQPKFLPQLMRFMWRARINPLNPPKPESLISIDAPRHDELRSIVNRGFSPRRITPWEDRAKEIVAKCMTKLESGGSFDVVRDLAVPLPTQIIAEMLGIGVDRLDDFKSWTDTIVSVASGSSRLNPLETGGVDALGELFGAMRVIVRDRVKSPQDDLISVIVDPSHGQVMSENDIINFVVLLLAAGNETTTNLIGNATNALLSHPEQLARVAADPDLIPGMIEEVLRFDPPVQLVYRNTTRDVELSGTQIPANSIIVPLLASANRDESHFKNAHLFDISRDAKGHMSFGFGNHFCLGASLARLEAKVAMQALIPHLSQLRRESDVNRWVDSSLVRGRSTMGLVAA